MNNVNGNVKIIFTHIGPPKSCTTQDIAVFLKKFLSNPLVVRLNPWLWQLILHLLILPRRPKKLFHDYQQLWDGECFNLQYYLERLAVKVAALLNLSVDILYIYGPRDIDDLYEKWIKEGQLSTKWLIVPMFPQFCHATTSLIKEYVETFFHTKENRPDCFYLEHFHHNNAYIDSICRHINHFLIKKNDIDKLIISFHSMPVKQLKITDDPYEKCCKETFDLIKVGIDTLAKEKIYLGFQSRFGKGRWLSPYTDQLILEQSPKQKVAVVCPGFLVDCLETEVEIASRLKDAFQRLGGHLEYIPCLNDDDDWAFGFARIIENFLYSKKIF